MTNARSVDDQRRMVFGEHLEELRRRLVWSIVGVGAAVCVTMPMGRRIVVWLCEPLVEAQHGAGVVPGTYVFSPLGGFGIYLKVVFLSALVLGMPWVMYQCWLFLSLGLHEHERRVVRVIAPLSAGLTGCAVLFVYYVMLPVCLWFLISFSASYPSVMLDGDGNNGVGSVIWNAQIRVPVVQVDPVMPGEGQVWFREDQGRLKLFDGEQLHVVGFGRGGMVEPMLEIGRYLHFATVLGVGVVMGFQLPVVMLALGWVGVLRSGKLSRYRKHCVLACFVVGALLTPADVLSMFMLSLPLWLLFELGILMVVIVERQKSRGGS